MSQAWTQMYMTVYNIKDQVKHVQVHENQSQQHREVQNNNKLQLYGDEIKYNNQTEARWYATLRWNQNDYGYNMQTQWMQHQNSSSYIPVPTYPTRSATTSPANMTPSYKLKCNSEVEYMNKCSIWYSEKAQVKMELQWMHQYANN